MNPEHDTTDFSWSRAQSTVREVVDLLLKSDLSKQVTEALNMLDQSKELYEKNEEELLETIRGMFDSLFHPVSELESDIENRRLSRELVLLSGRLESQVSALESERDSLKNSVAQKRETVEYLPFIPSPWIFVSSLIRSLKREIEELETQKKGLIEKERNLKDQETNKNSEMRYFLCCDCHT